MPERRAPESIRQINTKEPFGGRKTPPPNITAVGIAEDGRVPRALALIRTMDARELRELRSKFVSTFLS